MADNIEPLVLDLVEWVARQPRPYADVMDRWRTSCPRLTIWEDAVDRQLVTSRIDADHGRIVAATDRGHALLQAHGRMI